MNRFQRQAQRAVHFDCHCQTCIDKARLAVLRFQERNEDSLMRLGVDDWIRMDLGQWLAVAAATANAY